MKNSRAYSRLRMEYMIAAIKNDIGNGNLSAGDFISSELELGNQYQLSKNTVRKGLELLVSEGLIEKVPRIGARVLKSRRKADTLIHFAYYPSMVKETLILDLVERFHVRHPNIQIQPIPVVYPKDNETLEKFWQDHAFDVMTLNLHDFEYFKTTHAAEQTLEPLESHGDMYPFLNSPLTKSGIQYVHPFVFTPVILCYNKDHFREIRLPEPDSGWTWDDLREAAKKLEVGKDRLGFYVHFMSENRWPIMLLQNNVVFTRDNEGKYSFRNDKVRRALKTYVDIAEAQLAFPNFLSEDDSDAETLFQSGKASMIMATYSTLNSFKTSTFEYDIAPLPHLDELKTMLVIMGLAMNKKTAHKEEAQCFIDYLLSYESQLYIRQNTLSLPSVKQAAEWTGSEHMKRPYRFHMYREIVHTFQMYSDLNLPYEQLKRMRDELRYFWSNMEDLDIVLERLEHTL